MSAVEKEMSEVLSQKRQEVVVSLIDSLSSKNKDNYEACLNAHLILTELTTENEMTFLKLIQKNNIIRLMEASCDIMNPNQGYALSVLASVIKEYPEYDRDISPAQATEFQQTVGLYFHDLTYSCLLVIRSSDEVLGLPPVSEDHENQSGESFKRFGMRRIRAIELIKQELHSISKYAELQAIQ